MTDLIRIIIAGVALAAIAALVVYQIWYVATHRPKNWIIEGEAPEHLDIALEVIHEMLPEKPARWGGIIRWVKGHIMYKDPDGSEHAAAGLVIDAQIPEVKVEWFENIGDSALPQELLHVFTGWPDGDKRLVELWPKMNAEIKKRIAAVS